MSFKWTLKQDSDIPHWLYYTLQEVNNRMISQECKECYYEIKEEYQVYQVYKHNKDKTTRQTLQE